MNRVKFTDRQLVIATKHGKESVIAPVLEDGLGLHCFINEDFDTDLLGTFSGEVERELDPVETARKKCLLAMEASGCDLGVASEGSFGPHPSMFFASCDDELLIFIDKKNNLEIIVRELSTETNFDGKEIAKEKDLLDFAHSVKFPSHGLIMRSSKSDFSCLIKGITTQHELIDAFLIVRGKGDSVYVETDMRAMYNPTRMAVIQKASKKLLNKINSTCPQCSMPGFGIVDAKSGLKCTLCSLPTKSTLSHVYKCQHCACIKEEMYPHGKKEEDPMYCDYCNP